MTPTTRALFAVRWAIEAGPPIDPFDLAGDDGIIFHDGDLALVGLGLVGTVLLPDGLDSSRHLEAAAQRVAAVTVDDHHPQRVAAVVAFGALPFSRAEPGSLVIPQLIYGADKDGDEWVTVIAERRQDLPSDASGLRERLAGMAHRATVATGSPAGRTVTTAVSDRSFEGMVETALGEIDSGTVSKVVLARQLDVEFETVIDRPGLLRRWHSLEPNCTVFALPTEDGQFLGASPELLIERRGPSIHSRPLAGTTDRLGDRSPREGRVLPGELLDSAKDGSEHRLVVEAIDASLRPLCSELTVPNHPDLIHFRNITHLGTSVAGTLAPRADGSLPTALDLVGTLHPTPAVGGVPRDAAVALIDELETEPRGHYAGPVGYVDGLGDGRWMLGIRSVSLHGTKARLAAGVGIVSGSIPATELVETNLKFKAVLDAIAPAAVEADSHAAALPVRDRAS